MKTIFKSYLSIFIIYFIIDVAYQYLFGMNFAKNEYINAGINNIFVENVKYPILILVFFILITIANVQLALKPAVEKKQLKIAFINAFLVGITSYGTLALANAWSIKEFPLTVMVEIFVEGMLFSALSTGVTAKLFYFKSS